MDSDELESAFNIYWQDMEICRSAKAYWALLHVTVCLPDICAALQSKDGKTKGNLYIDWCEEFLPNPKLSGEERYEMRCKVLHEGRAGIGQGKRYDGFSFAQPPALGQVVHECVDGNALIVDIVALAEETRKGVMRWLKDLQNNPSSQKAENAKHNAKSLVHTRVFSMRIGPDTETEAIVMRSS